MPRKTSPSDVFPVRESSFNEAAADCRGKQRGFEAAETPAWTGFNEAAADCRGKRPAPATEAARDGALQGDRGDLPGRRIMAKYFVTTVEALPWGRG